MPPEKPLREMTPAELFDEINADGSNFSDKASRARMAGLEALRRLQAAESDRAAVREQALREAIEKLEIMAGSPLATGEQEQGLRFGVERPRKLLTEKRTP
jgi:hypothetical protein